jgi:hypothetical protein
VGRAAVWPEGQWVEKQQDRAKSKRRLGGVKLAATWVVRVEFAFGFVDAVRGRGVLFVVAPDHFRDFGGLVTKIR